MYAVLNTGTNVVRDIEIRNEPINDFLHPIFHNDYIEIQEEDNVQIGDIYEDGVFTTPEPIIEE